MNSSIEDWIYCEDRLPDDDEDYLITDGENMMVGFYRKDGKGWDNVNYGWINRPYGDYPCGIDEVIAWRELPALPFPKDFFKEQHKEATSEHYDEESIIRLNSEDIKLPNTPEEYIQFAINATNLDDEYYIGMRNGLRLALSFITGEEPEFENVK